MRIPLSVGSLYEERRGALATFFIQIPSMRVARSLVGIVDTGSPFTSISPRDALTFGLPFKHWAKGELVYLAGFKFFRHSLEATLNFKDSEGKLLKFRQTVQCLVPTKIDESSLIEMQAIPSLIGTDFMEDNDLTLVFNPSGDRAYFEKVETPPVAPPSPSTQTNP